MHRADTAPSESGNAEVRNCGLGPTPPTYERHTAMFWNSTFTV
jgi:hypothetical protein